MRFAKFSCRWRSKPAFPPASIRSGSPARRSPKSRRARDNKLRGGDNAYLRVSSLIFGWSRGRRDDLIDRALSRRLVGPEGQQLCPVGKPTTRYVIVSDLDDQLRPQRLPFAASLRAPPALAAGRSPRETRRR